MQLSLWFITKLCIQHYKNKTVKCILLLYKFGYQNISHLARKKNTYVHLLNTCEIKKKMYHTVLWLNSSTSSPPVWLRSFTRSVLAPPTGSPPDQLPKPAWTRQEHTKSVKSRFQAGEERRVLRSKLNVFQKYIHTWLGCTKARSTTNWIIPLRFPSMDMDLRRVSMASWLDFPKSGSPLTAISWSLICRRPS